MKTIRVIYEDKLTGGKITAGYVEPTKEEEQNTVALKPLAQKGFVIELRQAVNKQNVKTADALINGEYWEIKTNYTPTKNAIDNALRKGKRQAQNVILDIQSGITEDMLRRGVKSRVLKEVMIKKGYDYLQRQEHCDLYKKRDTVVVGKWGPGVIHAYTLRLPPAVCSVQQHSLFVKLNAYNRVQGHQISWAFLFCTRA